MIKVIIIGSGQIVSTTHLPNLMLMKDEVEVVGIVNVHEEKARVLASQYGIPLVSSSYQDLISKVQPDAAVIAVPNRFHAAAAIDLLDHGINVFCEKPPAANGLDALKMENAALKNGKLLTYGFQFRYSKDVALIDQLVQSGEFGKIYHLDIKWLRRRGIPGWGRFTNKDIQGGGPLIDIGCHLLDLGLHLIQYPKARVVLASKSDLIGRRGGHGFLGDWDGESFTIEDSLFAMIRLENDISITLSTSFAINIEEKDVRKISIYGDRLGAEVFPLQVFGETGGRQFNSSFIPEDDEGLHLKCIRNFIRAVEGREKPLVTAQQGTQLQTLLDALYQSAESGQAVEL